MTLERSSWASFEGLPIPLGVTWIAEEEAWNFAVYSEHADRVTLVLCADEDPTSPVASRWLDYLRNKSEPVWHSRILAAAMKGARLYAYQVEGPRSGRHSFDPEKIASQGNDDLYMMVNTFWEPLEFLVQEGRPSEWRRNGARQPG